MTKQSISRLQSVQHFAAFKNDFESRNRDDCEFPIDFFLKWYGYTFVKVDWKANPNPMKAHKSIKKIGRILRALSFNLKDQYDNLVNKKRGCIEMIHDHIGAAFFYAENGGAAKAFKRHQNCNRIIH